jgi:trehalose/maltose hydrolase-like predicted phosphorylase
MNRRARSTPLRGRLWAASAVELEGDERRSYISTIACITCMHRPRYSKEGQSIPARDSPDRRIKARSFGTQRSFYFPFLRIRPALARKLVQYRYRHPARCTAKGEGVWLRRAFYAWESQEGGREGCTDFNVTDVFTHRPVRTYFRDKQIHISGDIVYAMVHYAAITGDSSVLSGAGAEVVRQVARFFLSHAYQRSAAKRWNSRM